MLIRQLAIIILIALLLFLQFMLWFGQGGVLHFWESEIQRNINVENNSKLERRNEILKAQILNLQNDKSAIEEEARSQLGLIKKGETLYRIIEPYDNPISK